MKYTLRTLDGHKIGVIHEDLTKPDGFVLEVADDDVATLHRIQAAMTSPQAVSETVGRAMTVRVVRPFEIGHFDAAVRAIPGVVPSKA